MDDRKQKTPTARETAGEGAQPRKRRAGEETAAERADPKRRSDVSDARLDRRRDARDPEGL